MLSFSKELLQALAFAFLKRYCGLVFFFALGSYWVIAMCQTSLSLAFYNQCFIIKVDLAVSV